jgi:hypothetical protein
MDFSSEHKKRLNSASKALIFRTGDITSAKEAVISSNMINKSLDFVRKKIHFIAKTKVRAVLIRDQLNNPNVVKEERKIKDQNSAIA